MGSRSFWKWEGTGFGGDKPTRPQVDIPDELAQRIEQEVIAPLNISDRKKNKIRPAIMRVAAGAVGKFERNPKGEIVISNKYLAASHAFAGEKTIEGMPIDEISDLFAAIVEVSTEYGESRGIRKTEPASPPIIDDPTRGIEINAGYGLKISAEQVTEGISVAREIITERLSIPDDKKEEFDGLLKQMVETKAAQRRIPAEGHYQETEKAWGEYNSAKRAVETFLLGGNPEKVQQTNEVVRDTEKAIDKAFGYERSR